jgi:diphosphomevalonate decarboxylase
VLHAAPTAFSITSKDDEDLDSMKSRVRARANIALIKYWGKTDEVLNTPAVGSLSITLDKLWSDTEVVFDEALAADEFLLNGQGRPEQLERVSHCLGLVRAAVGIGTCARVTSDNNFPTGAGLASSASGFAALTVAAAQAVGLDLSRRELSIIARQGSGSAARSLFGGYVEMHAGTALDGLDSFAEPLMAPEHWPLEVIIAVTERREKKVSSRTGMNASTATSPYYPAWVATSETDLQIGRQAILSRDFEALATVAEHSCLKMHAAAMANQPPLFYWNSGTVMCMEAVRELRASGHAVFFTIDAGPQLKAVCEPACRELVVDSLRGLPSVADIIVSGLGQGVENI